MSIYDNLIQPINGMEMWSRSEEACILPPQYSRQPGKPKTVRRRDALEKLAGNGTKLGRIQKSLKCVNCGRVGHNVKTCHRHLPPKDKNAANKKRKMNSGDASSSQPKPGKRPPLSKNELRKNHLQVAEYQRKKMAELKASRKQGAKATAATTAKAAATSTSASTRPPTSTKASKGQASIASRSSQRIRDNSKQGGK